MKLLWAFLSCFLLHSASSGDVFSNDNNRGTILQSGTEIYRPNDNTNSNGNRRNENGDNRECNDCEPNGYANRNRRPTNGNEEPSGYVNGQRQGSSGQGTFQRGPSGTTVFYDNPNNRDTIIQGGHRHIYVDTGRDIPNQQSPSNRPTSFSNDRNRDSNNRQNSNRQNSNRNDGNGGRVNTGENVYGNDRTPKVFFFPNNTGTVIQGGHYHNTDDRQNRQQSTNFNYNNRNNNRDVFLNHNNSGVIIQDERTHVYNSNTRPNQQNSNSNSGYDDERRQQTSGATSQVQTNLNSNGGAAFGSYPIFYNLNNQGFIRQGGHTYIYTNRNSSGDSYISTKRHIGDNSQEGTNNNQKHSKTATDKLGGKNTTVNTYRTSGIYSSSNGDFQRRLHVELQRRFRNESLIVKETPLGVHYFVMNPAIKSTDSLLASVNDNVKKIEKESGDCCSCRLINANTKNNDKKSREKRCNM